MDTTNAPEYGGQEYDEEGDDVPLPDGLGGDEEEEEAQSEEEEEESEEVRRRTQLFGMKVRICPSLFQSDLVRAFESSNFSKNVTVCTGQELCLFDDTTTCFGCFTVDVDMNGNQRK